MRPPLSTRIRMWLCRHFGHTEKERFQTPLGTSAICSRCFVLYTP